jgi:hypothetical protein
MRTVVNRSKPNIAHDAIFRTGRGAREGGGGGCRKLRACWCSLVEAEGPMWWHWSYR